MNYGVKRVFSTLIDISKAVAGGSYIASFVGYILQRKEESWVLLLIGLAFTLLSLSLSYLYGRRYKE